MTGWSLIAALAGAFVVGYTLATAIVCHIVARELEQLKAEADRVGDRIAVVEEFV